MPTIVRMPEVLANATEAVIQSWLVTEGQPIAIGDPIAEIETDKALVEYAAEVAGVLARFIAEPGTKIAVGDPIAVVLAPGESPEVDVNPDVRDPDVRDPESGAPVIEKIVEKGARSPAAPPPQANRQRLFATPLVRRLAEERGIDLHSVTGTGPGGRIVRRDIDSIPTREPVAATQPVAAPAPAHAAAVSTVALPSPAANGFTDVPLTGMRKAIARRLTESKTTVPHFYVSADCRVDALLELRKSVNAVGTTKVSVNDFVLKAVAGALLEVPDANAIWNTDSIRRFDGADIAVAIAVDGGLLTPVLRGVDLLPLSAIAAQIADLAARARDGKIKQHELEGGSFSVSNLGMYGVSEFSAILNPPHSGILAVGAATARPVVVEGELAVGTVISVTLSADHRVIDGAVAAQWMAAFVRRIENPLTILI